MLAVSNNETIPLNPYQQFISRLIGWHVKNIHNQQPVERMRVFSIIRHSDKKCQTIVMNTREICIFSICAMILRKRWRYFVFYRCERVHLCVDLYLDRIFAWLSAGQKFKCSNVQTDCGVYFFICWIATCQRIIILWNDLLIAC